MNELGFCARLFARGLYFPNFSAQGGGEFDYIKQSHHWCKVIVRYPARPFLRRLIDLSCTVKSLDHHVRLSTERILFQCDNMAVVRVLQSSTAKDSHLLKLLRYLTYFAVKFNFNFSAIHLDGKLNRGPDCLSRLRLQAFKQLYPYAEKNQQK